MTRILHLTDLHLRHYQPGSAGLPARLSREMPAALKALTRRLPELKPEVLVISGDLLDVPDEVIAGGSPDARSHDVWLPEVERDYRLIREWLVGTGIPFVLCPGNHDHEPLFRRVFPEALETLEAAGWRFHCFWDELGPDRQPRRTAARRALFEAALTRAEQDLPQIHVQHYITDPPTTYKGWRYDYEGAAEMKAQVEASGRVRAVLSGHYHPGVLKRDGGVLYSGPPAFCEAPHPFRVYDFGREEIAVEDHTLSEIVRKISDS